MEYLFGNNELAKCPFCGENIIKKSCTYGNAFRREEYQCPLCGEYSSGNSIYNFSSIKIVQALYYYMLNEKSANVDIVVISSESSTGKEGDRKVQYISEEDLLKYYPNSFSQQIDRALLNLSKAYSEFDSIIKLTMSGSGADIIKEFPTARKVKNLIFIDCEITEQDYSGIKKINAFLGLMADMGYLIKTSNNGGYSYSISSNGWLHIQNLQKAVNESKQAFVAMWFDSQTDTAWKKISKAIRDCGYIPIRIDKKEHNNQIVPEILYEIKQSRFVVTDLTGNRNGVYYEAGYAQALNKEVIVTWKKTDEPNEQPHFDVAQKNMIRWTNENELYRCLVKRIEATVGKQ